MFLETIQLKPESYTSFINKFLISFLRFFEVIALNETAHIRTLSITIFEPCFVVFCSKKYSIYISIQFNEYLLIIDNLS